MTANQFVSQLKQSQDDRLITVHSFRSEDDYPMGHAPAIVIDRELSIAVMLRKFGNSQVGIDAGNIVQFTKRDDGKLSVVTHADIFD